MKIIPHLAKKTEKVAAEKLAIVQENKALLAASLKELDTFVSSKAPTVQKTQSDALSKICELSKTVIDQLPKK